MCWLALVAGCYGLVIPMAQFRSGSDLVAAVVVYSVLVAAVAALHVLTRCVQERSWLRALLLTQSAKQRCNVQERTRQVPF